MNLPTEWWPRTPEPQQSIFASAKTSSTTTSNTEVAKRLKSLNSKLNKAYSRAGASRLKVQSSRGDPAAHGKAAARHADRLTAIVNLQQEITTLNALQEE